MLFRVKLVTQRLAADCAICCMAMMTDLPYERVYETALIGGEEIEYGLRLQQIINTLQRLDRNVRWHWPEKLSPNNTGAPLRELVHGKDAIHLVPSLSRREYGTFHCVFVHNGVLYDPAPGGKRVYKRYSQLLPLGVVYEEI